MRSMQALWCLMNSLSLQNLSNVKSDHLTFGAIHYQPQTVKFTEFNLNDALMEGIEASRYENATPIQASVIPHVLEGKDVLGIAQTGTGKTAAFLLPLINRVLSEKHAAKGVQCLIIVPTRELATQVEQHLEGLSYFTGISSMSIYGGGDGMEFVQEKKALTLGAEFVICTPGRMIAHLKMGYVKFDHLKYLVLDEADRMLDMGFYEDIMYIVKHLPTKRQTLMFSATMPDRIRKLSRTILHQPVEVSLAMSKPPAKIVQKVFFTEHAHKIQLMTEILSSAEYKMVLVFCSSKISVKQLTRDLVRKGLNAQEIHSDLEQAGREEVLLKFKAGNLPVLVATDILSRGIDIDNIDLVVNFDIPRNAEDYVHRIGRTARAEAGGTAITLVEPKDQYKFRSIERIIGQDIVKIGTPAAGEKSTHISKPRHSGTSQRNSRNYSKRK